MAEMGFMCDWCGTYTPTHQALLAWDETSRLEDGRVVVTMVITCGAWCAARVEKHGIRMGGH